MSGGNDTAEGLMARSGKTNGAIKGGVVTNANAGASGLVFEDVAGGYGSTLVVRGLSGRAKPGEVLCVLGRNGVGKSTLMKLLLGYIPALKGRVLLDGVALDRLDPPSRRRRGITYCPQERPVFDDLSIRDNLTLMRRERDLGPFATYFARFPILERRLGQHAGTLSGGEKKILSIVRGLSEEERVVVLDEPSEGVQWENILHMADLIAEHKARGAAFIVVEQNLAFAERIADHYLIMDQGKEVLTGPSTEIDRAAILAHLQV